MTISESLSQVANSIHLIHSEYIVLENLKYTDMNNLVSHNAIRYHS